MFAAGTYHQMTENPPPAFQYTSYYAPQHRQIMSFSPAANAETLPGGSNQHHTTTTTHSVPPSTWPVSPQQQAPSASQNERTPPNPNPIVNKSTPPSVSAKQSQTTSQPNSASQTLTVTPQHLTRKQSIDRSTFRHPNTTVTTQSKATPTLPLPPQQVIVHNSDQRTLTGSCSAIDKVLAVPTIEELRAEIQSIMTSDDNAEPPSSNLEQPVKYLEDKQQELTSWKQRALKMMETLLVQYQKVQVSFHQKLPIRLCHLKQKGLLPAQVTRMAVGILPDADLQEEESNSLTIDPYNGKKPKDLYAISQAAVGYRKAAQDLTDALFSYEELSTSSVRGFGTVKGQDPKEGLDGKRLGTLYKCVKKYHGSASDSFINSALRDHFKKYRKQAEKAARNREQAAANQQPPPDV